MVTTATAWMLVVVVMLSPAGATEAPCDASSEASCKAASDSTSMMQTKSRMRSLSGRHLNTTSQALLGMEIEEAAKRGEASEPNAFGECKDIAHGLWRWIGGWVQVQCDKLASEGQCKAADMMLHCRKSCNLKCCKACMVYAKADCAECANTSPTNAGSVEGPSSPTKAWSVEGPCHIDGACVQSPNFPKAYSAGEKCIITADPASVAKIDVITFDTESNFDFLTVNGKKYSGTSGPKGETPSGNLVWSSDYSVEKPGWKLCLPVLQEPKEQKEVVVRKEVRELSDAEASRFIKAWKELMASGEMKRLAHMHGITKKTTGEPICVHGHENFAGWHRIYMVDVEKALQKADKKLGGEGSIALPYWDWQRTTIKGQVMPKIIRDHFIDKPDDTVKAFYEAECQRWTGAPCASKAPWGNGPEGVTLLDATGGLPSTPDDKTLKELLEGYKLNERVKGLMAQKSHDCAAGNGPKQAECLKHTGHAASVEDPHNNVHNALKWPMSSIEHAPYSPIFFLHHNNLDRLYEMWLQANPKATDKIPANVLHEKFDPWTIGLSGDLEGKPHVYSLSDCLVTEALGYKYDSLLDTGKMTGTQFLQGTASGTAEVIFPAVDFSKLDSLTIEVAVVPKGTAVPLAAMQGKRYHQRKAIYGAGFCGLVGIFSEVGMGHPELEEIDCTAAINQLNIRDVTKLDVVYFCATDVWTPEEGWTDRVQECSDAISPPRLVRDGALTAEMMEMTRMAMAQHTEHSH